MAIWKTSTMPNRFLATVTLAGWLSAAIAQTPAPPAFEVASIKPAGPINPVDVAAGKLHVGMTISAGRVDIASLTLTNLIGIAYNKKAYQIAGPSWMTTERFDVLAKLPEGATREQVPEMLQALLAERFKLAIHKDSKEQSVYALVVGRNGPKLKEAEPDAAAPSGGTAAGAPAPVSISGRPDAKGGVVVSGGQAGPMRMEMGPNGAMHMEMKQVTMSGFADMLARFVDRPVVDRTELKGNYQVALDLSMEVISGMARSAGVMMPGRGAAGGGEAGRGAPADAASDPSGTSIFASVQQLGLKLEPRKMPVELIVVDHLEKAPTEN
jgi:uncharacterized protein (TIGR03435 family)